MDAGRPTHQEPGCQRVSKPPPLPKPEDWRKTNPGYEYSPPVQSADGRVVWIDGGVAYDWWRQDEQAKATRK